MKLAHSCVLIALALTPVSQAAAVCPKLESASADPPPSPPPVLAQILIKLKPSAADSLVSGVAREAGIDARPVRRSASGAHVVDLGGATPAEREALVARLRARADVERVESNRFARAQSAPPGPEAQWNLLGRPGVRAIEAWWPTGFDGRGSSIAVLDSGIVPHPKLPNVVAGFDFISRVSDGETLPGSSGDGDGRDADASDPGSLLAWPCKEYFSVWHGTGVASLAAGVAGPGPGPWGVAPGATIVNARVLGAGGYGSEADIADAVVWAAGGAVPGVPRLGWAATVINMSLGGPGACSAELQEAIDFAVGRGVPVVVAAGNDDVDASNTWPAGCKGVITVAATNRNQARWSGSNWGATVALGAPGEQVWAASNTGTHHPLAASFDAVTGTSAAAPHVSGTIAMLRSANPTYGPAALKAVLQCTATQAIVDCEGCGRLLDAKAAMDYVTKYSCTNVGPAQICGGPCFPFDQTSPFDPRPKTPPIDGTR